jgi:hypothetical protein
MRTSSKSPIVLNKIKSNIAIPFSHSYINIGKTVPPFKWRRFIHL